MKKDFYFLLILAVVASLLRLWYFQDFQETAAYPLLTNSDSHFYYTWARDIASGDVLNRTAFMKAPLYAYLLGFFFKLFGASIAIAQHIQFIFGIAHILVVYYIARNFFGPRTSFLAGLLCSCYGLF